MISSKRKLYLTFAVFGCIFAALIICGILPLFTKVRDNSRDLVRQKTALNLFQAQLSSLADFQKKYPLYQEYLTKIKNSFVDPTAPINFMEFLEAQAEKAGLRIKISALSSSQTSPGFWLSTQLEISLAGSLKNCLRFLEELQHSPWLVEIFELSIGRLHESVFGREESKSLTPNDMYCAVSLKVFSGEDSAK